MHKHLISIIIPVYNSEAYLTETIQSVLNQSWANKELIIIDDGSTDDSLNIARSFENSWIKVYQQENRGAAATRNLGLKYAQGDFIQYLDGDDLISSNKIEFQVNELIQYPKHVAVCSTIHFKEKEELATALPSPYEEKFLFSTDSQTDFLINLWGGNDNKGSMIQTNAWLIPKEIAEIAGKWEEFYSPDDDGEYFSRVILASSGVRYVQDCFNYYRKTSSGLANRNSLFALEGVYRSTLLKQKNLLKNTHTNEAKFAIARLLIALAVESYPAYPSLTKKIVSSVKEIGNYSFIPVSGGPYTRILSFIFGWKFARHFQVFYAKIRNNI